jgi:hypothetical protein
VRKLKSYWTHFRKMMITNFRKEGKNEWICNNSR